MDNFSNNAVDDTLDQIEGGTSSPGHFETKSNWEATQRAFDAFKSANDRLTESRRRGAADPTTEAEVRGLEAELDKLTHAPESKSRAAPENKALPHRTRRDPVREAVIAMGKEVLKIGTKVSTMRQRSRGPVATLEEARRRISALEAKHNRPRGMGMRTLNYDLPTPGRPGKHWKSRYKAAVVHWMRTGEESHEGERLYSLMAKAMHTELNPRGGWLVTPERMGGSPLEVVMAELSPLRREATVHTLIEGDVLEIPTNLKGTQAGWVAERDARPTTETPQVDLTSIPVMELYAMPAVSQRLLDSVNFDPENWLTNEVAEAFALQEGSAYMNGTGVTQPYGLLTYPYVTDHTQWTHGKFRQVLTGAAGAFPPLAVTGSPPTHPGHVLIDTQYALKTQHRAKAKWLFNRTTAAAIRKLTDERGNYLWQPGVTAGQPPTLLASEIVEEPNIADIGADTVSIGYGDWKKVYCIVEKGGVRVLRDPFSNKPNVLFYTTKLVGGSVVNFDAAVFLKFGTS